MITTTILLIMFSLPLYAPAERCLYAERPEIIQPFENLIDAIGFVETGHDTIAINYQEQAYGFFQVRKIRLDDYYLRSGITYLLVDMLDYDKAREVFLFYCSMYGPYEMERIARRWNGSGPMSEDYLKKVSAKMKADNRFEKLFHEADSAFTKINCK